MLGKTDGRRPEHIGTRLRNPRTIDRPLYGFVATGQIVRVVAVIINPSVYPSVGLQ
jgi:hypothetical protein